MWIVYTELAHNGSKNEFASTDTVSLPIFEVYNAKVSLSLHRDAHGHFLVKV